MKAMSIKNSTRPSRAAILFPAAGLLILTQSLSVHAAIQQTTGDSWMSSLFSPYGITALLVLVLGSLFAFKMIQKRRQAQEFADVRPSRTRKEPEEIEDFTPMPAVASVSRNERRPHPIKERCRPYLSVAPRHRLLATR